MRVLKKIEKFAILCFLVTTVQAQTCVISGKVIDAKSLEPLPMASVFFNNTTIGTMSDAGGNFVLANVRQPAIHELIVSFLGYEPLRIKLSISTNELNIGVVRLKPLETELNTVEVKSSKDTEWEKKFKRFKKIFLGDDNAAEQCTILNPWVVDFQNDPSLGKKIVASAASPIEIENKGLGYKVNFYLSSFIADNQSYLIKGYALFEPLKSSDRKTLIQWEQNREKYFYHSSQHLFKAIIDHRINGEGFDLYADMPGIENANTRSTLFRNNLGSTLIAYDTNSLTLKSPQKDIFLIPIKGRLEVHYRNEKLPGRFYQDIRYPVSWMTFTKNYVLVNKEGAPINSAEIIIEGALSEDRVAHLLPLDYQPFNQLVKVVKDYQQEMHPFYEKIYIHTDKGYYYPGETLWFKGYINYSDPLFRDSLSRTMYVDFIHGETRKILLSKTILIDSGIFRGDFTFPDTLKPSDYYLRAYTNLNRNFGDDNLYKKLIPILNFFEKPEPEGNAEASQSGLKITADKVSYNPHEKITLAIRMQDEDGNPIAADLSVSVTDASKVLSIPSPSILSDFNIKEIPEAKSFKHPAEYGIGFRARLKDDTGKPAKGSLNILQMNPKGFYMALTDDKSIFSLINLFFYDTSQFSFQIIKGKKQVFGSAELLEREAPRFPYQTAVRPFKIVNTQSPQTQQSTVDIPKGARLLKEVIVKAPKMVDPTKERPYGRAEYVIKSTDLNLSYGNLLLTLSGKVPGLIVRQAVSPSDGQLRWVVYNQRSATSSASFSREVVVLVNNAVMAGLPGDIIGSIDPSTVESIEVTNRVNPMLGESGCCGMVNIFTKSGLSQNNTDKNISFLKIVGYSKPRNFIAPAYDKMKLDSTQQDNRALLYWNSNVVTNNKTGEATVSFFASDNGGQYRAIVEGVTQKGKPVRSEYLINVNR